MAKQRTDLQSLLESLIGSRNVYFQPPENFKIKYPCIIYELSNIDKRFADNIGYMDKRAYQVTVVDKNPDSTIPLSVSDLPMCRFNRFYTADNLNHFVFTLYF